MIFQWKEKCMNFQKSAVVKVGSGHDFRKLRSKVMYNVFFKNECVLTKTVIKIDSTKVQINKRCVIMQTASLQMYYIKYLNKTSYLRKNDVVFMMKLGLW